MNLLISDAWAQTAEPGMGGGLMQFLPLIAIVVIFYFLLIRPQQKRAKEHRAMVEAMAKGDEVVTNGGLLGRITEVGESFISVEIAAGVQIKVQKHAVASVMPKGTIKAS
jgi:preprotein translocase subunit YajC